MVVQKEKNNPEFFTSATSQNIQSPCFRS